jgi:hypothetical protein
MDVIRGALYQKGKGRSGDMVVQSTDSSSSLEKNAAEVGIKALLLFNSWKILPRVDGLIVDAYLVMEVRAGRSSG